MPDHAAPTFSLSESPFQVGPWTVLPEANRLHGQEREERLEPKATQVLVYLAERAGQVVPRSALLDDLWPDVFVTENALSRCISQLRKAFDDDPRDPRFIETIPKTGYRLIAPVRPAVGGDGLITDAPLAPLPTLEIASPPPQRAPISWLFPMGLTLFVLALATGTWLVSDRAASRPLLPQTAPLTATPGIEYSAALAPDGERVAFIAQTNPGAHAGLFVKSVDVDTPLLISDEETDAAYPAWAPDGQWIAFFSCTSPGSCALLQTSATGQDTRRLADGLARPWGLTWSPDSSTLVFSAHDPTTQTWRLFALDHTMPNPYPLTTPPATNRGDLNPIFSPDGQTIAFKRSNSEGVGDLYRMPTRGGLPQRLTNDAAGLAGHTWTPNGRTLIFSSNRNGRFQLWRILATGGTPERLADVAARDPGFPVLSMDGQRLVFEEWMIEVNLWGRSLEAPDTTAHRLIASAWWNKQPAFAPDGQHVAFVSARSGTPELWRAQRDGRAALRLTHFDGATVGTPAWSPTSQQIALEVFVEEQADIYVIDATGGTPLRLTTHEANDRAPRWSRDGQWLYFSSDRTGTWQIWKTPTGGGAAQQVTQDGGRLAVESYDGTALYITRFGEPGLWSLPINGGTPRLLIEHLTPDDWGNWAVTKAGLFVVYRDGGPARLHRLDPVTGQATPLDVTLDRLIRDEPGLSLTPDGRFLLYARIDRMESDLAHIESFFVSP
ncbi:MAG TPA: winged helix-turn-helix domain-containing protein [Rhodothermales bacterium]|nr:winged helix-turn-helix domain-containing protein [Rhodothermales bacterium]